MPDAVTLNQHFRANGYRTMCRGKIYHCGQPDTGPGAWDEIIFPGKSPLPDKSHPRYGNPYSNIEWGPVSGTEQEMDDYKAATWAIERLGTACDKPFFLACGFKKPHLNWCVPEEYFDMFPPESVTLPVVNEHDLDDVPPKGMEWAEPEVHYAITGQNTPNISQDTPNSWRDGVAAYLATVAFVDRQVGRILDALDASAYRDNTIIVLWSDHGWHLGEKLHWKKFALWEEATRSPLMFVVPGLTVQDARCDQPVSLIDIYPTLVDICGLSGMPGLEGRSLRPFLKKPGAAWERPALTTFTQQNHSLRTRRWRYIRYRDGTEELYDRASDPHEWTNLLWSNVTPEHRMIADRLAAWLPDVNG